MSKMTYGYLRVSTDQQDENNQRIGVNEKAKKMGLQIDEYIIDKVSGTTEPEKRKLEIGKYFGVHKKTVRLFIRERLSAVIIG